MTKLTLAAACVTLGLILLATQIVHSAPAQDAENEIREQIVARFAAMEGRRFAACERFLADSYVSTDDGADKKAVLADVRADHGPGRNTTHGSPSEFHVQFCGSAAVASYRVLLHETFDAQVLSTDYRKCETYIKQDGAWKHVALAQQISNTPRVPAKLDTAVYDDYVGRYEVGPHFIVHIRRDGDRLIESASDDPKPVEDLPYSKERFFQRGASGQDVFLPDVAGKVTAVVREAANGDIIAHKIKPPSYNADAGATWGRPAPEQGSRVDGKSSPGAQKVEPGKEVTKSGEDTGGIVDSAALHQEIQQLSKAWNAAWLENDSSTVDRLMASDYVYVAPNGQVLDRRTILGVILSPTYKIHQGTWTELQIKVFSNDAAVIIDRWQGTGTLNGTTFTDDHRCARLCLRRNGTWQIAFEQASPVKP